LTAEPGFVSFMRDTIANSTCDVRGCSERWAAPVVLIDAPAGFGEETWIAKMTDTAIVWHMGGGRVVSHIPGHEGKCVFAKEAKVSLQPRDAEAKYHAATAVRFGHFYVSDALLGKVCEGLDLPSFTMKSLRTDLILVEDAELRQRLDHYARRTNNFRLPPSRVEMEALALLVVERLIVKHHLPERQSLVRGGLAPWQLKRACQAMMAHLDADLGLDDLAQIAGCSATHLSRAFKQSMGLAPFHWLAERRIEKAKELLEENRLSLAEIALACGFSAQPQFTTAFGRAIGLTPGQWRRERLS